MTQDVPESGADPVTLAIGRRVAELRRAGGLSQVDLGEAMAERGVRWSRTSVAKLEGGKRAAVTAQELLALALVFDLPPLLLLADPRAADAVPIADGSEVPVWNALLWLSGDLRLNGRAPEVSRFRDAWLLLHAGRDVAVAASLIGPSTCPADASEQVRERYRDRQDKAHRDAIGRLVSQVHNVIRGGGALPEFVDYAGARNRALELDMDDAAEELDRFANGQT